MIDERLREAVRAGGLLAPGRPVVAMLSGGRDSTCLLDLAVSLLGAGEVSALHVNYGLREQADAEERHCLELCAALGVELDVVRASRPSDAAQGAGRQSVTLFQDFQQAHQRFDFGVELNHSRFELGLRRGDRAELGQETEVAQSGQRAGSSRRLQK